MDKVTYSSDTTAAVPGANLTVARRAFAASSSRANALPQPPTPTPTSQTVITTVPVGYDTGYFGGGSTPSGVSTMDKITYSSETLSYTPTANLTSARSGAATGNTTHGYFSTHPMDKVSYSSDTTTATTSANLSVNRGSLSATGNSTHGYFGGGWPGAGSGTAQMDKVTYASDTTAAVPGANFSLARYSTGATGSSTHGYFGGGWTNPGLRSTMDKVTYSTDTAAAVPGANLTANRENSKATGNSEIGYFAGGTTVYNSTFVSTIDKVVYSTDTTSRLATADLSAARRFVSGASSRANALPTTSTTSSPVIV